MPTCVVCRAFASFALVFVAQGCGARDAPAAAPTIAALPAERTAPPAAAAEDVVELGPGAQPLMRLQSIDWSVRDQVVVSDDRQNARVYDLRGGLRGWTNYVGTGSAALGVRFDSTGSSALIGNMRWSMEDGSAAALTLVRPENDTVVVRTHPVLSNDWRASVDSDGVDLFVLDAESGVEEAALAGLAQEETMNVLSDADGPLLICGERALVFIDAPWTTPHILAAPSQRAWAHNSCSLSADGTLAVAGFRDGDFVLIDVGAHQVSATLPTQSGRALRRSQFSDDDERVIVFEHQRGQDPAVHHVHVFAVDTQAQVGHVALGDIPDVYMDFTPDASRVLSWEWRGGVYVHDVSSGYELQRWHVEGQREGAIAPDGEHIALALEHVVVVYEVATGRKVRQWHPR